MSIAIKDFDVSEFTLVEVEEQDEAEVIAENAGAVVIVKGDKGDTGDTGAPGKDGYTPIKGIDYFDGAPGKDGENATPEQIAEAVEDYFEENPVSGGDEVFVVNIQNENNENINITADKTYDEIIAAEKTGKKMIAIVNGQEKYPFNYNWDGSFVRLYTEPYNSTISFLAAEFSFKEDGTIVFDSAMKSIPEKTSQLENDSGFITLNDIPESGGSAEVTAESIKEALGYVPADEADIPEVPTKVSAFENDAGYAKKSEIPSVPTKTSELTNDSGFITAKDIPAIPDVPVKSVNGKTGAVQLSHGDVGAEKSGAVAEHNVNGEAHNDIRIVLNAIKASLEAFLNIDDAEFDQLSELIQAIKANAGTIEQLTNGKVNVSDIINNLTTNSSNKPLSAAQGVVLKGLVDSLNTLASGAKTTADEAKTAAQNAGTTATEAKNLASSANTNAQNASDKVDDLQERMDSGEFKGEDGTSVLLATSEGSAAASPYDRQFTLSSVTTNGRNVQVGDFIISPSATLYTVVSISGNVAYCNLIEELKGKDGTNGTNGKDGVSVSSVKQTTTSSADGGSNVITVTLSNGTTSTFTVKNGTKGSAGADGKDYVLTEADKEEIAGMVDVRAIPSYWETAVANATSKVKALQNLGGKDVVNFLHFADMHYSHGSANYTDNLGSVAAKTMRDLNIPIMAGCGDMTRSGVATSSDLVTADVVDALETLEPVGLENLLYCKGNHDGAWGTSTVYGTNYAMIQHPDKQWNNLFRWQAEDFRRVFSKDGSYFYIDNIPQKVRYIVLNSHWADYSEITDEDYNAGTTALNTQKNINYGDEQAEWLAKTALDFNDKTDWTVVVFTHAPLWNKHNGVTKSYLNAGNAAAIRNILIGFYEKSSSVTYKSGSTVSYSNVDESNTIAGVFTGHAHTDIILKHDEAGSGTDIPFPIVTVTSAGNVNSSYEEGFGYPVTTRTNGTDKETAFDIVCINKKTKTINTVRVGAGSDRNTTYGEEAPAPVTLLSISATYSGGSVDVGTSVNSLTGITVTAHYSDGSTENVTGYTLSGTISKEGNNTITVSYEGKTTTFIVVGIGKQEETTVPITWLNGTTCTYAVGSECKVSTSSNYVITEKMNVAHGKTYNLTGGPAGANGTLKFVGVDSNNIVTEAKDFNMASGNNVNFSWTPTSTSTTGLRLRTYSNAIGGVVNTTVLNIS